MLYIFRSRNSAGARDLTEGILLVGTHARRTKGRALQNLQRGDGVICWGDNFAVPRGVEIKTLNNVAPISKFAEAQLLAQKNVATVQVSRTRPAVVARPAARPAFQEATTSLVGAQRISVTDAETIAANLQRFVAQERERRQVWERQPAPVAAPAETWLPRRNNHVGGNDLLTQELPNPDFYSKKENLIEEYRLHIFKGKSIRAGKKIHRPEGRPNGQGIHPWIRSFDAGWIIAYDGFTSTKPMRDLAVAAVKALDLDFAAVDIGKKANGDLLVLEVNRAPGCEGNTVTAYANKIVAWYTGREQE